VARKPKLCHLDLALEAVRGQIAIDLLCDGKSVGEVTAYDVEAVTLRAPCRRALKRVNRAVGLDLTPYVVFYSKIPPNLRGTGVGTALYLAAAEAASRLGGALLQHACFYSEEDVGTTSIAAQGVWEGGRFGRLARVSAGRVAYLPPDRYGCGEGMLGFGQMEFGAGPRRNNNPRLSGADARCWSLGTCVIETDNGRPVDAVQAEQLLRRSGVVQQGWADNPGEVYEEQFGDWHLFISPRNGSHAFTLTNDESGVVLTGGEPGDLSQAQAAARRIIMRWETRKIGDG
jgi:hypothetical protein